MSKKCNGYVCAIKADCRFCDYEKLDQGRCPVCQDCKYHVLASHLKSYIDKSCDSK